MECLQSYWSYLQDQIARIIQSLYFTGFHLQNEDASIQIGNHLTIHSQSIESNTDLVVDCPFIYLKDQVWTGRVFTQDKQHVLLDPKTLTSSFYNILMNPTQNSSLIFRTDPQQIQISSESQFYNDAKRFKDKMQVNQSSKTYMYQEEHDHCQMNFISNIRSDLIIKANKRTYKVDAKNHQQTYTTEQLSWQRTATQSYELTRTVPESFLDQIIITTQDTNAKNTTSKYTLQTMTLFDSNGIPVSVLVYQLS